ncbi:hypothetical protein GGX14DRAFT_482314, partial [Mycena pura]
MAFDPAMYGNTLPSYTPDAPGFGYPDFPVSCPTCQAICQAKIPQGMRLPEISDATARMVLGDANMDEWLQARFLVSVRRITCPYRGCGQTIDVDDVLSAALVAIPYTETCVQCPRCKGLMCRACKSVWHDNLTCLMYQTSSSPPTSPYSEGGAEYAAFKHHSGRELHVPENPTTGTALSRSQPDLHNPIWLYRPQRLHSPDVPEGVPSLYSRSSHSSLSSPGPASPRSPAGSALWAPGWHDHRDAKGRYQY